MDKEQEHSSLLNRQMEINERFSDQAINPREDKEVIVDIEE